MSKRLIAIAVCVFLLGNVGCSSTQKGAAIGAGTGAAVGGVIGHQSGNTAAGALIGAVVGGAAGAYIGNYMDKQAEEIEQDLEGATVQRIGEGIKITFESGILFEVDESALQPAAETNLTNLAEILVKYDDTEILIEGHTDSQGSEGYNLELSRRRAQSVSNYLAGLNVVATRFTIMGYGEAQPVLTNDTSEGRQANRRVEIAIMANDDLKKTAEKKVEEQEQG